MNGPHPARRSSAPGRFMAMAALLCLLPSFGGCKIYASQQVSYHRDGQEYPPSGTEATSPRALKKNDLVLGIRKFALHPGSLADELREAGNLANIAKDFVEAVRDARIFKEVHYPLRDEKIDVEIEPLVRLDLVKSRLTNALKVFPGVVFPWIDGFGFNYDHTIALELRVRDAQRSQTICDTFLGKGELRAKRYPSIFWLAGLHAGLFILLIFETVTTDTAVCQLLAEKNAQSVDRDAIGWLLNEFAPTARACPNHPTVKENTGRFCVICRTNLRYPILNREDGADRPKSSRDESSLKGPAPATATATPSSTTETTPPEPKPPR